jgi:hypothetical protein
MGLKSVPEQTQRAPRNLSLSFGAPSVHADYIYILNRLKLAIKRDERNQNRKFQTRLLQLTASAKSTTPESFLGG